MRYPGKICRHMYVHVGMMIYYMPQYKTQKKYESSLPLATGGRGGRGVWGSLQNIILCGMQNVVYSTIHTKVCTSLRYSAVYILANSSTSIYLMCPYFVPFHSLLKVHVNIRNLKVYNILNKCTQCLMLGHARELDCI